MSESNHTTVSRLLVRAYKLLGVALLFIILFGVLGYLVRGGFYMVDNTWVRPRLLLPADPEVVETANIVWSQKAKLSQRRDALATETSRHKQLVPRLKALQALADEWKTHSGKIEAISKRDPLESMQLRWEQLEVQEKLASLNATKDKLERDIKRLESETKDLESRLQETMRLPRARAMDTPLPVVFVPYENMDNVSPGSTVYGCSVSIVFCTSVGKLGAKLPGEIEGSRPNSDERVRGFLMEVELSDKSAIHDHVLFAGKKPFWIL